MSMAPSANGSCIVLVSGPVRAGKTTLANGLVANHGFIRLGTRAAILKRLPETPLTRESLQLAGELLDLQTHGEWVADDLRQLVASLGDRVRIVVDAVRIQPQVEAIRRALLQPVLHVHVTAPLEVLRKRYETNEGGLNEAETYDEVRSNLTEGLVEGLANAADLAIDTSKTSVREVIERVVVLVDSS